MAEPRPQEMPVEAVAEALMETHLGGRWDNPPPETWAAFVADARASLWVVIEWLRGLYDELSPQETWMLTAADALELDAGPRSAAGQETGK